jgi:hypothetical protein
MLTQILFSAEVFKQIRIEPIDETTISTLQSIGIDLDHVYQKKGVFIEFAVSESDITRIEDRNISFEVVHEDLQSFYEHRLTTDYTRDFGTGSMGGYYTFEEIVDHLNELHNDYPNLVSEIQSIGQTLEGREIWSVKLSDNPNVDEDEPEMLYIGLHHAREPMSYMNLFYYMYWLTENYGTDPEATALLENRELWFIPAMNPDGLVYNQQIAPNGGGMQRKNHRETCSQDWDGIDLNRNYSFMWAYDDDGSSPYGCDQTYRGTEPFSEPETEAVKNFIESHDFPIILSYHSYGNLLIHPFGYIPGLLPPEPDLTIFREYGNEMVKYNHYSMGTGIETVGYTVNGEATDYYYGEYGIYAYTPEVGAYYDGFWPSSNRILPLAEENLHPNQFSAWMVGAGYTASLEYDNEYFEFGQTYSIDVNIFNQGLGESNGDIDVNISSPLLDEDLTFNLNPLNGRQSAAIPIEFSISNTYQNGDIVDITVSMSDNTNYTFENVISITIGEPVLLFSDGAEFGLVNWETNAWGTTSDAYNGNSAFTDSPFGIYGANAVSYLQLAEPLNLSDVSTGYISYAAKWQIETSWDWAQVEVSTDNNNWIPLQGELMNGGTGQGVQFTDEYGYDGISDWVTDQVSIASLAGEETVWFRFSLSSDGGVERDGIYIDNIGVYAYQQTAQIGDINTDGNIDVLDVVQMVQIIIGAANPTPEQFSLADLNTDNTINVQDIVLLVNLIIG